MLVRRFLHYQRIVRTPTSSSRRRIGIACLFIIYEVLRVGPCFFTCPSVPHHLPPLLYQEPSNVQQTFSNEKTPTVWCIIPALEFLIKRWELMVEQPRFRDVKDAITHEVCNLKKWYQKVDNTSSAYFICLSASPHACCLTQLMSRTDSACLVFTGYHVKDTKPCYLI